MATESDMGDRPFGSRLAFCAYLVSALPAEPIDVDERDAEVIKLAEGVLRDGLVHDESYLRGLSAGLLPVIQLSERRAAETERREYKPGDNYGFSGAVDTSSESYRYTATYLQTLSSALSADPVECANYFRGAMSLFALYSCDTNPKGAVRFALDEARDKSEAVIEAASRAAPAQWWTTYPWTAGQTTKDAGAEVFVSFKNLDSVGRETRDCLMAKTVAVYLRHKGFSVFLSLDSLEQLGKSAYMEAIETALQDAKVLIAVGASADNLNSRWVKFEWHSFHQEIIEGYKKDGEMFSVIEGITEKDLPLALRQRQAFRFSEDGLGALSRFLARSLGKEQRST